VAVSCEHGNEILGPVKGNEFLEYLSDFQLFKDSGQGLSTRRYVTSRDSEHFHKDFSEPVNH
jgi:hypothetical protein